MICPHASECSGCSFWSTEYSQQMIDKTDHLRKLGEQLGYAGEIQTHSLGSAAIRDRADLQWRAGVGWGFLNKDFKQLKVIDQCPLFSEPLQKLFIWWSQFHLKAPKASVRLRVDSEGRWGVWLDMANIEVKDLLQEDELLSQWVTKAQIEIGQRFKVLKKIGAQWKLADPELRPWFVTCDSRGNKFNLYGSIGSFTQVGRAINQKLVSNTLRKAESGTYRKVIELGAGSGNFTLGFASEGFDVVAVEQSSDALSGLQRALQDHPHLIPLIQSHIGNFQTLNWGEWAKEECLLFLDPPRSGVGVNLLKQVPQGNFPAIIYVTCGVDSWFRDGQMLNDMGYQLSSLEWVDQFPNTSLYEVISYWKKRA